MEPLVVDLDGTLIRNDLTHELLVLCARWFPWLLPIALIKLLVDRGEGKRWLVALVGDRIDPSTLPYDQCVLGLIKSAKAEGRRIELVSGSDHLLVSRVGEHLGVFDFMQGSSPGINLTAKRKADFLQTRYSGQFYYAGNSTQDLPVWSLAKGGYGVRAPKSAYRTKGDNEQRERIAEIVPRVSPLKPLMKAMRPHQWAKNILLFVVPGLFITQLKVSDWLNLAQAFMCFGMMASGTYLLNDLFDISDDRAHQKKRTRPLASGDLSIPAALLCIVLLCGGAVAWAFALDRAFFAVLVVYALVTIAYSFRLKRLALVDVFILAGLFSLRVIAGAEVIGAPPSTWLLTFVGLIFLSLALAKRYVEVSKLADKTEVAGRGYVVEDAPLLLAFGAASSFAAIMALAIYGLLVEERVIQSGATLVAIASVLAAWSMRIWMKAVRKELDDDPVLFAIKDGVSVVCLIIVGTLILVEATRPAWMGIW